MGSTVTLPGLMQGNQDIDQKTLKWQLKRKKLQTFFPEMRWKEMINLGCICVSKQCEVAEGDFESESADVETSFHPVCYQGCFISDYLQSGPIDGKRSAAATHLVLSQKMQFCCSGLQFVCSKIAL